MNIVELAKKLIEFPSYTENTKSINDCIDYCINYFKNNKKVFVKKVEQNGIPSVLLSNVKTMNFDMLDVGHVDVVPVNDKKMFIPRIENGIMYGRGTSDMKGSVASSIKLLEYIIENNLPIKYGTLIVGDEETGGADGARYWTEDLGLKTKILLDGDAGKNLNVIIQKAKGICFIKLISKGESAHGSRPWLAIDAIENLINTINNLRKEFPYISKEKPVKDQWITTMHVGIIKGGIAVNAIAPYAEAELDFRFTEITNKEKILEIVKKCSVGDIESSISKHGNLVFNEINNKFLQLYKKSVEKIIKQNVVFEFATGGSDSRYFYNGSTTIIPNQPTGGEIHGDNEWIDIKTIEQFLEIKKDFVNEVIRELK